MNLFSSVGQNRVHTRFYTGDDMQQMTYFGYACPICKHFSPAGKIEIDTTVPLDTLNAKLQQIDWVSDWFACEECGQKTFVSQDQLTLGGLVVTLAGVVEFPALAEFRLPDFPRQSGAK